MSDGIRSGAAYLQNERYIIRFNKGLQWHEIPRMINKFGGSVILPVHFKSGYSIVDVNGVKTPTDADTYRRAAFMVTHELVQAYCLRSTRFAGHEVKLTQLLGIYPVGRIATHSILRGTYVEFLPRYVEGATELEPMHWVD
jgi:hypothetical protein